MLTTLHSDKGELYEVVQSELPQATLAELWQAFHEDQNGVDFEKWCLKRGYEVKVLETETVFYKDKES